MKILLKVALVVIFWIYLILYISTMILNSRQPKDIREIRGDEPICEFVLERSYSSELTDYCVEGDKLYLLWGRIGVLEVYTLDGNYQKSFAFDTIQNGKDRLEKYNDAMWLKTKHYKVYRFHKGVLLGEVDYSEFRDKEELSLFEVNEKYDSENGSHFVRAFNSIKRVDLDGSTKVIIKFTFSSIVARLISADILHIGVMLLLLFLLWRIKHNT